MSHTVQLTHFLERSAPKPKPIRAGTILSATSASLSAEMPGAGLGDLCLVERDDGVDVPAEVVGFFRETVTLAPFSLPFGISAGNRVRNTARPFRLRLPADIRGRVLNALGEPLKVEGEVSRNEDSILCDTRTAPPNPLDRDPIRTQLVTCIPVLDLACPLGRGQRIGLFSPPGVGKSTLLGQLVARVPADVVVVGLIGERGREIREFLDTCLPEEQRRRSVVVAATSDECAIRRRTAALTATTIAEYFRDKGLHVLLLIDSLTRVARAMREIGLAAGEAPVRQGFPASVLADLPVLLERAGPSRIGSITAVYSLLSSEDGHPDFLEEEVKGLLDGHIVLSRARASSGFYPAIDPIRSISRLRSELLSQERLALASRVQRVYARLEADRDLAAFGASNIDPELLACLSLENELNRTLYPNGFRSPEHVDRALGTLFSEFERRMTAAEIGNTADITAAG